VKWMLSPKGSERTIRMVACISSMRMSRSARPIKSAKRLTGVTRKRSTTPALSSAMRLKPTPAAPNIPSWIRRPGTKTL